MAPAFTAFRDAWLRSPGPISLDVIHQVLISLFLVKYRDNPEFTDKWEDPVECWIAAYALQEDGSFIKASDYTPLLAKLIYWIRAVIWFEAYREKDAFQGKMSA